MAIGKYYIDITSFIIVVVVVVVSDCAFVIKQAGSEFIQEIPGRQNFKHMSFITQKSARMAPVRPVHEHGPGMGHG